jgi:SAM-dependent methyltransferase
MMLWEKKLSYLDLLGLREYSQHTERLATIKEYKKDFKKGLILDVGCGKNYDFLKHLFGKKYFGLDLAPYKKKNFINHNINSKKLLFKNNSVPNVICTDVLEHVDNPHLLLKELFRISSGTVIVSLPNNWPTFYLDLIIGQEIKKKVGYGLFKEPQPKGLRHQFFFNFEHACNFLEYNCGKKFYIKQIRYIFEHTNDGMLSSLPLLNKIYNSLGKIDLNIIRLRSPVFLNNFFCSRVIYFFCKFILVIIKVPNIFVTTLFYGFGIKRFYNLFCRQVWFVYHFRKL